MSTKEERTAQAVACDEFLDHLLTRPAGRETDIMRAHACLNLAALLREGIDEAEAGIDYLTKEYIFDQWPEDRDFDSWMAEYDALYGVDSP